MYVPYDVFQDVVKSLEKRFLKIEERLKNNQKLIELSDKMLEIKNEDN